MRRREYFHFIFRGKKNTKEKHFINDDVNLFTKYTKNKKKVIRTERKKNGENNNNLP